MQYFYKLVLSLNSHRSNRHFMGMGMGQEILVHTHQKTAKCVCIYIYIKDIENVHIINIRSFLV